MPDRPLVPYMRYSKKVWPEVRAENPDSPLWDFGRIIGQLWNNLPPAEKLIYQQEYEAEKVFKLKYTILVRIGLIVLTPRIFCHNFYEHLLVNMLMNKYINLD
jgi:hypothetical protein